MTDLSENLRIIVKQGQRMRDANAAQGVQEVPRLGMGLDDLEMILKHIDDLEDALTYSRPFVQESSDLHDTLKAMGPLPGADAPVLNKKNHAKDVLVILDAVVPPEKPVVAKASEN